MKEQKPSIKNPNTFNNNNNDDIKAQRKCNLKNKLQSYRIRPTVNKLFSIYFFVISIKFKLTANFQNCKYWRILKK